MQIMIEDLCKQKRMGMQECFYEVEMIRQADYYSILQHKYIFGYLVLTINIENQEYFQLPTKNLISETDSYQPSFWQGVESPLQRRSLQRSCKGPQIQINNRYYNQIQILMFIGQNIANTMAYNNSGVSDTQLKQYIDQVMYRYDTNRNGTLQSHQLTRFFNELFQMCGIPRRINQMEAINFMRQVDMNYDNRANKFELFRAFKMMMSNQGMGYNGNQNDWNPNFAGYGCGTNVGYVSSPRVISAGYRMW